MKSNLLIFTLAVGGALLMAGCTSPGGDDDMAVVEMKGSKFQPDEHTIEAGATVKWINRDSIGHNVASDEESFPTSRILNSGQTYEYTFDEPGVYTYHCEPHPFMTGTIIVLNEDGSTPSPESGNGTGNETA